MLGGKIIMYNQENYYFDDYSGLDEYRENAIYPKAMPYVVNPNMGMNTFGNNTFVNTFMMPSYSDDRVVDSNLGLIRGNMFENLYDPYRNFKPVELRTSNEREKLLQKVQQYAFAMNDIGLYLDIYPNNKDMLNLYNEYLKNYNIAVNNFERRFGPLSRDSIVSATNAWNYDNKPWPWEVQK